MDDPSYYDDKFFTSQISKESCEIIHFNFSGNTPEEKLERVKQLVEEGKLNKFKKKLKTKDDKEKEKPKEEVKEKPKAKTPTKKTVKK
jgi:hypothetical protein